MKTHFLFIIPVEKFSIETQRESFHFFSTDHNERILIRSEIRFRLNFCFVLLYVWAVGRGGNRTLTEVYLIVEMWDSGDRLVYDSSISSNHSRISTTH